MSLSRLSTTVTLELLQAMAADRGLEIPIERLELRPGDAREVPSGARPLALCRLEYVPTSIEPATALQWIQNGGRLP